MAHEIDGIHLLPPTSTLHDPHPHLFIWVLKIKWKKGSKKRFSAPFLNFSYLIPLQKKKWKGSKSDVKKILSSDIFKIYLKIFFLSVVLAVCAKSFLSIWKKLLSSSFTVHFFSQFFFILIYFFSSFILYSTDSR